ncbi:MAG: YHS domain-containing protein [candidate division Zixibacteria bacterium]|nr:YHS domain-containing protein [candidate division Zixibacteria bacterium]
MEGAENVHHDIVCGMDVEITEETPRMEYEGETYYFCSEYCKEQFEEDPEKYAEEMEKMHGEDSGEHM